MIYQEDTQIDFYDLDGRGDMKLTALLKHINRAAGVNAADIGVSLEATAAMGLAFVLQRFAVRVFKWPVFRQTVTIRTWAAEITKGTFRRNGDMRDGDGNKIVEWTSLWVLIDIEERKVRRPKALPVTLPAYGLMDVGLEIQKPEVPAGAKFISSYPHVVRFSELDVNNHMNNAVYADLIANVMNMGDMAPVPDWHEVHFNYLAETKLGEEVDVQCRQSEKVLYITGAVESRQVFAAMIKITK